MSQEKSKNKYKERPGKADIFLEKEEPQKHVHVKLEVSRPKRRRRRATDVGTKDRRLHLQEVPLVQKFSDRSDDFGSGLEHLTSDRVQHQVEVPPPVSVIRFFKGTGRKNAKTRRENFESGTDRDDRELAHFCPARVSGDTDDVPASDDVEIGFELFERLVVLARVGLDLDPRLVLVQVQEPELLPGHPDGENPAGKFDNFIFRTFPRCQMFELFDKLFDGEGRFELVRVTDFGLIILPLQLLEPQLLVLLVLIDSGRIFFGRIFFGRLGTLAGIGREPSDHRKKSCTNRSF